MSTNNTKKMAFSTSRNENYMTINLVGVLGSEDIAELDKFAVTYASQGLQDTIVNCQHLSEMSTTWIRSLSKLGSQIKADNKQIRMIYVSSAISRILKQEGVGSSLPAADNLHSALADMGLGSSKLLDVNFINPFLIATMKVLETQTSTKAVPGKIYKKSPGEKYQGDISGVIGLISEAFSGSVVISFPASTFLKIMSRMLGEEYTTITKEIEDGAGEITNIIFGQAKVLLNEQGFGIKTAIPSVVAGNEHTILPMSSGPRMVVPFQTDVGPFFIEVCVSG